MDKVLIWAILLGYSIGAAAQRGYTGVELVSGKYGIRWTDNSTYKSKKSKWVLNPEYDSIQVLSNAVNPYAPGLYPDFWIVYKNGYAGVFGSSGNGKYTLLLDPLFDKIKYSGGFFALSKQQQWGLYNAFTGKLMLPHQYEQIDLDSANRATADVAFVKQSGKTGVLNLVQDYWILKPGFETVIKQGNVFLTSLNGKMGAYFDQYDRYLKARVFFPVIPQGMYNHISIPEAGSNILVVDSAGRKGVWQLNKQNQQGTLFIEAAYESIQFNYNSKNALYTVYRNGGKGEFNQNGWIAKPAEASFLKRYDVMGTAVAVQYLPGIGFDVLWTENDVNKKWRIEDKIRYDHFELDGDILLAKAGDNITGYFIQFIQTGILNNVSVGKSQLLFSAAQSCRLYPSAGVSGLSLKERIIIYENSGLYGWWNIVVDREGGPFAVSGPMNMNGIELYSPDRYKMQGAPLLLVNDLGRYGIISAIGGKWLVPAYYEQYKIVNDSCIWFREKPKDAWNLFNAASVVRHKGIGLHEKFNGISWFYHNGKAISGFDTIAKVRSKDVLKIDGSWFMVKDNHTVGTNIFGAGDELQKISANNGVYVVFETASGAGVKRNGKVIVLPCLADIQYIEGGFLLLVNGKSAKLELSSITDGFNAEAFEVQERNISCRLCSGNGFIQKNETITLPAEKHTHDEPYQVEETSYEQKWDPATNSYKGYRTVKIVTRYKTVTTTTPQRTETVTRKVNCGTCRGTGKVTASAVCTFTGTTYRLTRN